MSDESLKFDTGDLNSPRDKLIELINMDMKRDSRVSVRFKTDGDIMKYGAYIASVEKCTRHRAIASVSAMGVGILYYLERNFLDNDKYEECRKNIIPYMMLSGASISRIITNTIKNNDLLVLDGRTVPVWMWDDISGDICGFANRYYIGESSLANYTFWLGLDKLVSCEELYSGIITSDSSDEVMRHINYAKTIVNEVNDFYASIYDLNNGGHLFHDF